ncbi:MAG: hypothetical protein D3903_02825 [Candidatus Electrothrix sp. GM3_4]|nr:hypothetical protein [Candidatus Electrothrix sp. GM3_4]
MFYSPLMNELKNFSLKSQGDWQAGLFSVPIASNFYHLVILFVTLQNDQSTSFVGLWQEDQTSFTSETTRQRMRDYLFLLYQGDDGGNGLPCFHIYSIPE